MKLYKGYVKNEGKSPVDKIAGIKNFRSLKEVQRFDSYGGVLAEDAVLIDIDDAEQSEILKQIVEDKNLNCQIMRTSRGRHFTFINNGIRSCGINKKLACGLTADIKIGSKNTVECLKIDGVKREIEREFDDADDAKLPKYLLPIESKYDFFHMKEGDGRDSDLYSYILILTNNGFGKEDSREVIRIINEYLFDESLTEDDIQRITRDEAFPDEAFYDGKKFLHNRFGDYLIANNHVKNVGGQLMIYRNGIYVSEPEFFENFMIRYLNGIKSAQRTEVMKYLRCMCVDKTTPADSRFIGFKNGVLNIDTDEFFEATPEIVMLNRIPWDYNPSAYSEKADKFLDDLACGDAEIRSILEESIGYCFFRQNELSKSFFLTGNGANGKSTFLEVIEALVGDENYSALDLNQLDERFSVSELFNKLVNIGDDIADDFWDASQISFFKKIVSGNAVKGEIKGDPNIVFNKPYVKLFFSANDLPRVRSKAFDAIERRLVIIPFNNKFTKNSADFDKFLAKHLCSQEHMGYFINLGLQGLKRVLENDDFTTSEKVEARKAEYKKVNNSVIGFVEEIGKENILERMVSEIYILYQDYCIDNGFQTFAKNTFSREIRKAIDCDISRRWVGKKQEGFFV